jgi:hypothetical protein
MNIAVCLGLMLQQSGDITFDFPVGPLVGALKELSIQARTPCIASGVIANETVFLHVKKRPFIEVLSEIAKVTTGKWSVASGIWTLTRDDQKVRAVRQAKANANLRELEAWRSVLITSLAPPFNPNRTVREFRAHQDQVGYGHDLYYRDVWLTPSARLNFYRDPAFRALARSIANIDLTQVANLEPYEQITFATDPNPSQTRLPVTAKKALSSLQAEQKLWSVALNKNPPKSSGGHEISDDTYVHKYGVNDLTWPWKRTEPYLGRPTKIILTFRRPYASLLYCELHLLTKEGKSVLRLQDTATIKPRPEVVGSNVGFERKLPPFDISTTPESKALWSHFSLKEIFSGHRSKAKQEARSVLRNFAIDPVNQDPLWFGNQELLTMISTNENVIACLPDVAFRNQPDGMSSEEFLRQGGDEKLSLTRKANWFEVTPLNRAELLKSKIDRAKLGAFVRNHVIAGEPNLIEFGRTFHCPVGFGQESSFYDFYSIFSDRYRWYNTPSDPFAVELFCSISDRQWTTLMSGKNLRYRDLTARQLHCVEQHAFQPRTQGYFGAILRFSEGGSPPNSLARFEPTTELSQGILGGTGLGCDIYSDDICISHSPNPDNKEAGEVLAEFDLSIAKEKEHDESGWIVDRFPQYVSKKATFEMRKRKRYVLKIFLSPGHYFPAEFTEPYSAETKRLTFEELPRKAQLVVRSSSTYSD